MMNEVFGVSTVRCQSAVPTGENQIDVALGCGIARWNFTLASGFAREWFLKVSEDVVSAMVFHPPFLLTLSFGGDISIWDQTERISDSKVCPWKRVASSKTRKDGSLELAWSDSSSFLAVLSENNGGSIEIFQVSNGCKSVKFLTEIIGHFLYLAFSFDGNKIITACESFLHVFSITTGEEIFKEPFKKSGLITAASPMLPGDKFWVISQGNVGIVIDRIQCKITTSFVLPSSARITKALSLCRNENEQGGQILYGNDSGKLSRCTLEGIHDTNFEKSSFGTSQASGPTFFISYEKEHIWQITSSEICLVSKKDGTNRIEIASITCVGLSFNPKDEQTIAIGDMAGNVFIWNYITKSTIKTAVPASIRSLTWSNDGSDLFIGTLDGTVLLWKPFKSNSTQPSVVFALSGSITVLSWARQKPILAIATTEGTVAFLTKTNNSEDFLRTQLVFRAHKKQTSGEQDLRFGSLSLFCEIWSAAFSPDCTKIATCSEDQTTKIWTVENGDLIQTLKGHTTAVTSVGWEEVNKSELILTCADDRKVMIWDAVKFELLRTLNTSDLESWHTLTYLAIEPNGNRVVCVTQNGFLVMWNMLTGERICAHKIHAASIEGLQWDYKTKHIATCSSDCTANVFNL